MSCDYCHEDSDGFIRSLDKNGRAFIEYPNKLILRFAKERREVEIKHCPMCGRRLKNETNDR